MGVAGVVLTGVWGWSQHAEARRQANAEASARRHLISMLEVSTGPMADQLEQLGRLAVFDSLDTAVERALAEYAPEVRDPAFRAIEARYWDSRGIRLAARGKREEAYQAFVTARLRWLALGKRVESVLSGVKAAEQQWQQGRVGAMAKTIEQTRPPQPSPGMEGQMIDTVIETAAARALLLRGLLTEATRRLDAVIPRIASLLAGPLPEGSMRVMLLGTQTAALTSLSEAQIQRGDFLKAEAAGSRSLEIIRQLRRIEPGNFRNATLEARALMMMVKIAGYRKLYVVKHDLLETQRSFVQGLQHRDPANVVWRGLLAASLGQSGSAQMEAGNPQEAMSSLREAARLMIEVAETDPTNEMWQWDAAGYLLQAGYGLTRLNQHVEAESYFRRAVERMMLFAGIPDSPSADRLYGLSAAIGNLGDCLKRQNRPDDAVTHYQALIDHAAVARGAAWIFIAAVAGHEIAEVERARGSLADAITRHRAAFPLWRRFFASLQEP
ncbi:MAG: tetratricopeptide repeat protein, partial [Verrucomicrobiaceae bacterium]